MFIDAEELLPTPPSTPSPPMPSPSPPSSYDGKIMPLGHLRLSIRGCTKLQDADRGDCEFPCRIEHSRVKSLLTALKVILGIADLPNAMSREQPLHYHGFK